MKVASNVLMTTPFPVNTTQIKIWVDLPLQVGKTSIIIFFSLESEISDAVRTTG